MKVKKMNNCTKTYVEKNKCSYSSRSTTHKESMPGIDNGDNGLRINFQFDQSIVKNNAIVVSPGIDLLNPIYSKHRRKSECNKNSKNISRTNSVEMTSLNGNEEAKLFSDIRKKKITQAKTKLAQGYYSKQEVYSILAEKIIDILI